MSLSSQTTSPPTTMLTGFDFESSKKNLMRNYTKEELASLLIDSWVRGD